MKRLVLAALVFALALVHAPLSARDVPAGALPIPPSGVLGVGDAQLTPDFWITLQSQPGRQILSRAQIDEQNAKLLKLDPTMHDLAALPATLPRTQVAAWVEHLSKRPAHALYDEHGQPVPATTLDKVENDLALDTIPAQTTVRYGLVVERAALRTFPTTLRVFSSDDDHDIDRFQESAEFPGTPVHDALAVAHVISDEFLRTERRNVEVDCASELCRGRTVVDLWRVSGREANAHVGVDVDAPRFLDMLVERIASLP